MKKSSRLNKRTIWAAVLLAIAVVFVAFVLIYTAVNQNIAKNVYIGDINASGMTQSHLYDVLLDKYGDYGQQAKLKLVVQNQEYNYDSKDFDIIVDIDAAVKAARDVNGSGNLFLDSLNTVKSIFVKSIIPFTFINFDEAKLENELLKIQKKTGTEIQPFIYKLNEGNSTLTISAGNAGAQINLNKCFSAAKNALQTMSTKPVVCEVESVTMQSVDKNAEWEKVNTAPKNATIKKLNGSFTYVKEKTGVNVDKNIFVNALTEIEKSKASKTIPVKITSAEIDIETLKGNMFKDVLSTHSNTFSTSTSIQLNRAWNIKKAVSKLDGVIIAPNEVFSYNKIVGIRSAETGFKIAGAYNNGEIVQEYGGGVCQTSSTIYNCVLDSDLQVIYRKGHTYTVPYAPLGQDATVSYPTVDFKWKNNTNYPIKIVGSVVGNRLTMSLVGTKDPENVKTVTIESKTISHTPATAEIRKDYSKPTSYSKLISEGHDGYVIQTFKTVKINGKVVSSGRITTTTYRVYPAIRVVGAKKSSSSDGSSNNSGGDNYQNGDDDPYYIETEPPTEAPTKKPVKTTAKPSKPTEKPTAKPTAKATQGIVSLD